MAEPSSPATTTETSSLLSARTRFAAATGVGAVGGAAASLATPWAIAVIIGWCAGAGVFIVSVWVAVLHADSARTRQIATEEDDSRLAADVALVVASTVSLVDVGFVLLKAGDSQGPASAGITALAVMGVVLAWGTVHTVFTLRYARLYWTSGSGIDFNDDAEPDYRDFAYLA
ncbi:MAG: DUF1345 domain-containing protein, partial [Acidimicrobiales bacterium]